MKSNKSDTEIEDPVSAHLEQGSIHKLERRPSFPEEEDDEELLVGGVSLQKLEEGGELELEYDMIGEMGDQLEYEMLDNITSCNVVDNYLMLDEYEQNLCKEHEQPPMTVGRKLRKWSLVRQGSSSADVTHNPRKRSVNNNLAFISSLHNKRTITTIQEDAVVD